MNKWKNNNQNFKKLRSEVTALQRIRRKRKFHFKK